MGQHYHLLISTFVTFTAATLLLYAAFRRICNLSFHSVDVAYVGLVLISLLSFVASRFSVAGYVALIRLYDGLVVYLACRALPRATLVLEWLWVAVLATLMLMITNDVAILGNSNITCMFLATALPFVVIQLQHTLSATHCRVTKVFAILQYLCATLSVAFIIVMTCKTALLALATTATLMALLSFARTYTMWRQGSLAGILCGTMRRISIRIFAPVTVAIVISIVIIGISLSCVRDRMSSVGRCFIWASSWEIIKKNYLTGIGIGQYPFHNATATAIRLADEHIDVPSRMVADVSRHAFCDLLEVTAELGLPGLAMVSAFLGATTLCLYRVGRELLLKSNTLVDYRLDRLALASMCCVASVIMMSLCHFPRKLAPIYLCLSPALAMCVNRSNNALLCAVRTQLRTIGMTALVAVIWAVALTNLLYVVSMSKTTHALHKLVNTARQMDTDCLSLPDSNMPVWDANSYFELGNIMMLHTNTHCAIECYKKALICRYDADTLESLALAYLYLASITTSPTTTTQHLPAFNEPPVGTVSSGLLNRTYYIDTSIDCLRRATLVRPWKLSPQMMLARIYWASGDTNKSLMYCKSVMNTPMKILSDEGVTLKITAQSMFGRLTKTYHDPGIVTFNIADTNTWHDGLW